MAKTSSMYIRIDPQVKADVEAIYAQYGLSLTDAINVFIYQSRNIRGLPFDLRPGTSEREMVKGRSMKGALHKYVNSELIPEENSAWEKAVIEKYGNT